jgi:fucose permease
METEGEVQDQGKIQKKSTRVKLVVLMAFFGFFIIGVDSTFVTSLVAFAVRHYGVTKPHACNLDAATSAAMILSSVLGIYLANRYKPSVTVSFNLVVMTASLLLILTVSSSVPVIWMGAVGMGFGMGASYGAMFNWIDLYLGGSAKISSILIITSTFGDLVIPVVVGPLFDRNPMVVIYTCLLCTFFCIVIAVIFNVYAKRSLGFLLAPSKSYSALLQDEETEWTLHE